MPLCLLRISTTSNSSAVLDAALYFYFLLEFFVDSVMNTAWALDVVRKCVDLLARQAELSEGLCI